MSKNIVDRNQNIDTFKDGLERVFRILAKENISKIHDRECREYYDAVRESRLDAIMSLQLKDYLGAGYHRAAGLIYLAAARECVARNLDVVDELVEVGNDLYAEAAEIGESGW